MSLISATNWLPFGVSAVIGSPSTVISSVVSDAGSVSLKERTKTYELVMLNTVSAVIRKSQQQSHPP